MPHGQVLLRAHLHQPGAKDGWEKHEKKTKKTVLNSEPAHPDVESAVDVPKANPAKQTAQVRWQSQLKAAKPSKAPWHLRSLRFARQTSVVRVLREWTRSSLPDPV